MNGKTTVDPINPCSAEMDRHTYGCKWLNVSMWGKRLLRVGVFGVYLDLYWSGWSRPLYVRMLDGAALFFPGGSLHWPLPIVKREAAEAESEARDG